MSFQLGQDSELAAMVTITLLIVTAVIHLFFSVGVYCSASQRYETLGVHFAPPMIWAMATLLGGVVVATAYWLIHLSALSPRQFSVEPAT